MLRLLLFLCLALLLLPAAAQTDDRIDPAAVAGAVTKTMQAELGLSREQLPGVADINDRCARGLAAGTGRERVASDDLLRDWEAELRSVLSPEQFREFGKMKDGLVRELSLAGLDRWTAQLAQDLRLSETQLDQVAALSTEFTPRMEEVRQGGDPPRIKTRRLRALDLEREEALRGVLTEEQFGTYERLRLERWEK